MRTNNNYFNEINKQLNNYRQSKDFKELSMMKTKYTLEHLTKFNLNYVDFITYINDNHIETIESFKTLINRLKHYNHDDKFKHIKNDINIYIDVLTNSNENEWLNTLNKIQTLNNVHYLNPYYEISLNEVFEMIYRLIIISICYDIRELLNIDFNKFNVHDYIDFIELPIIKNIINSINNSRANEINLIDYNKFDLMRPINIKYEYYIKQYENELNDYINKLKQSSWINKHTQKQNLINSNKLFIFINMILNYYTYEF